MKRRTEWEKIYSKSEKELPWYNLPLNKKLIKILNNLNKKEKLIVTGCGSGDNLPKLKKLGFSNLIGYDISKNAIKKAREKYPKFKLKTSSTEKIKEKGNIFDNYIIHHIPKSKIKFYIKNIDKIGKNVIICYFYGKEKKRKSLIKKKSLVYHHNPKYIESLFKDHELKEQVKYKIKTNPLAGKIKKYKIICQLYVK